MSDSYELLESLGATHPSKVDLTVAEATARELRGIPLAISGDPVPMGDSFEREWHRNNPGQPSPFDPDDQALRVLADMERQSVQLRTQPLGKDWIPVADTEAAPVVKTEAAGLSFHIEGTQIRLAVVPLGEGKTAVALIDEQTNRAAVLPLGNAALVGDQLVRIGRALQHDELELTDLGLPVVSVSELANRLGQFLYGAGQIADVLVVGFGSVVGQFGGLLGVSAGPVKRHDSSPSVGAPTGAVCDNSNPTEGDPTARPVLDLWPAPSHQALTDSITALAATQRRLMIGGRLAVAP